VCLLTVHEHPHTLDEAVDDLEGLSCGSPSLIERESVQPLQDRLNVLVPKNLLYEFDWVVISKVTHQQEFTHSIVRD